MVFLLRYQVKIRLAVFGACPTFDEWKNDEERVAISPAK